MSTCLKFLSHPINNQSVNFTVNSFFGLYGGVNDIVFPSGNTKTVLKPFSNLYVLESMQSGYTNLEPSQVNFINNSGLPNGLGLYKYNAITGKVNTTGRWNIAARYLYNTGAGSLYQSPIKYYSINIFPSGELTDNPLFEVVLDQNGNQLLPINSGGTILIPITGNSGEVGLIPSGFLSSGSGCISGLTVGSGFSSGFIFCNSGGCLVGQLCPYEDSTGITQEGQTQEPSKGGQKGDPVNVYPIRIIPNDFVKTEPSPNEDRISSIGTGCNFYTTMYIDMRERAENLFIGRIGSKYVRVDTQTWNHNHARGILRGINITKGFINSITNNVITSYTETEGTMYYVSSFGAISGLNEDPSQVYRFGNLYQLNKGARTPIPILGPGFQIWSFFVEHNIGIDNVTAMRLGWYYGNPRRVADSTDLGGEISIIMGELHKFDQIGGSLIENMQYVYNRVPLDYKSPNPNEVIDISSDSPWESWGQELKFTNINDKFEHFYGLDWLFTTSRVPSGWNRIGSGISYPFAVSNNFRSSGGCTVTVPCPPCDPGCAGFSGFRISNPTDTVVCSNGRIAPRWLCECYEDFNTNGPSTTSSLNPALFEELIN